MKIAILDDYQNIFKEIIEIEKYKSKFSFKIFNETFHSEEEAVQALLEFETLFLMRERTIINKSLIEKLPKLKYIMTSGMRNKALIFLRLKKEKLLYAELK